ncbi:cytochrome P450 [Mycena polygramma]|nr:cytochrome P450 [Mycena polygramma]
MLAKLLISLLGTAGAYALYEVLRAVYRELTSPLRHIPGPKSAHWLYGNMKEFMEDEDSGLEERWVQEYGTTFKFHRFFGQSGLHTTDTKAMHHFISNTHIYQKSEASRFSLGRIVGPGILVVEGDVHKQQRKIMNPAFGAPQVRELTQIFVDKSIQLRDIWAAQASNGGGVARVEVLSWLSKATLDIIGLAGFNYNIDALGASEGAAQNELAEAFEAVFAAQTGGFSVIRFFQLRFPVLRRFLRKRDQVAVDAQAMMRIGRELLAQSKSEVAQNGTFDTGTGRARDLLSLLVRANTSKDLPASQRLSDEDVIAQVPTFLVAGHETTSTAVTWALFALTQHREVQTRLREELQGVDTDRPTMDELNALPFLDCVVRETLRLYAPVPGTGRIALRDDVVPLATPYADTKGVVHQNLLCVLSTPDHDRVLTSFLVYSSLLPSTTDQTFTDRIRKGESIFIPILAINRDSKIWGPDAMKFRPNRWAEGPDRLTVPPAGAHAIPGVWGHMLTFHGGPRSCIGFRFALVEMKALLFTLIRTLEFELAMPVADMGQKGTAIVQRPIVLSDPKAGNQLPLLVRAAPSRA